MDALTQAAEASAEKQAQENLALIRSKDKDLAQKQRLMNQLELQRNKALTDCALIGAQAEELNDLYQQADQKNQLLMLQGQADRGRIAELEGLVAPKADAPAPDAPDAPAANDAPTVDTAPESPLATGTEG